MGEKSVEGVNGAGAATNGTTTAAPAAATSAPAATSSSQPQQKGPEEKDKEGPCGLPAKCDIM